MDPTPGRWGPFWTPITPEAGSLFHAAQQQEAQKDQEDQAAAAGDGQAEAAAEDAAGDQGADDETHDGGEAEAEPADPELVEKAYGRGMRARQRGMREDSIPPDVKNVPALSDAWLRGWQAGTAGDDA